MKILVKTKTGAKEAGVQKIEKNHFLVAVKSRAEKGKANAEVVSVLAEYFDIPKSNIVIRSGHTAKNKIIEIA